MQTNRVVIAGYGYLGKVISNKLLNQDYFVTAIRRNIESIKSAPNLTALSVDFDSPEIKLHLPERPYTLIC